MKKKAYIVGISPLVRVVAPADATEEQIISLAIEKMRKDPNEYIHATHCDEVREDTECPYSPETDETRYFCPKCGEVLERGQYYYDLETDTMRVDHCPMCDCEYGEPCEIDNE